MSEARHEARMIRTALLILTFGTVAFALIFGAIGWAIHSVIGCAIP